MNTLQYINDTLETNPKRFYDWVKLINWNKSSKEDSIQWIYKITKQKYNVNPDDVFAVEINQDNQRKGVKIIYSNDFVPDLVKFRGSKHDGTLIFSLEHIQDIFSGLLDGSTYCTENIPEDNYGNNPEIFFKYDVIYTIGDLLWNTEYIDHVDEKHGKNFPGVKDSFALAVKIDYIKRD